MIFILPNYSQKGFGLATAVREFVRKTHQARVLCLEHDEHLMTDQQPAGVKDLIKQKKWHFNDMFSPFCLILLLLGVVIKKTIIICPHGMLEDWALASKKYRLKILIIRIINFLCLMSDIRFHVLSESEEKTIQNLFWRARAIEVVLNPIPADILESPTQSAIRSKDIQQINIGYLSLISPKKNQLRFVEFVDYMRSSDPDLFQRCKFFIDGDVEDEDYSAQINVKINKLDLCDKIKRRSSVPFNSRGSVISRYDVFLFTSSSEGLAFVVLEARALRVVPIVDKNSNSDFVQDYGGVVYEDFNDIILSLNRLDELVVTVNETQKIFVSNFGHKDLEQVFTP